MTTPTECGPRRLGAWLDVTMSNRGIRNRDFAADLGVHESTVHNWRKGKNVPELATLQRIAQLLNVAPVRLAVTAGLFDASMAGHDPLPTPEPFVQRAKSRRRANELLDELGQLTNKIRSGGGDTGDTHVLEALNTIRKLIREEN